MRRLSRTLFYLGELVEVGNQEQFFLHPASAVANAFIGGNVGYYMGAAG